MRTKTKIAFFADILVEDFDGASRTMFQIIKRIPQDRFDFLFITGTKPKYDIGFEVLEIPNITIPMNATYKMARPCGNKSIIRKKLMEFAPDVIHIASPSPLGSVAAKIGNEMAIPVITIYHTHFISYVDYYLRNVPIFIETAKKAVARLQRKFYDSVSKVLVPTQQMIKDLGDFHFQTHHMEIWQRGLNHNVFNLKNRNKQLVRSIVKNNKPTLIFCSRLVWEKNLETLINVYHENEKRGKKFNLLVVGDGTAYEELEMAMPNAYMLGKVNHEKLAELYKGADVFIFPSISETYGNVVVEAMACGCIPVIAKGGGSQSLVQHGQTGFLCPPNDAASYLDYADSIVENQERTNEMILKGQEYTSTLDWEKLVDRYFEAIQELTKAPISDFQTLQVS